MSPRKPPPERTPDQAVPGKNGRPATPPELNTPPGGKLGDTYKYFNGKYYGTVKAADMARWRWAEDQRVKKQKKGVSTNIHGRQYVESKRASEATIKRAAERRAQRQREWLKSEEFAAGLSRDQWEIDQIEKEAAYKEKRKEKQRRARALKQKLDKQTAEAIIAMDEAEELRKYNERKVLNKFLSGEPTNDRFKEAEAIANALAMRLTGQTPEVSSGVILPGDIIQAAEGVLFPSVDPYRDDPIAWLTNRCQEFAWSKQREIMESVRDNRYTAVKACHGPGKSFIASRIMGWWVDTLPKGDAFVLWTAPRGPQVYAILGRELRALHAKAKLPGRITLDCDWYIGNRGEDALVGMGRKPADHDEHGFQGIHARYVLIVLDEACGIPKKLYDAAKSIVTNDNCRVLAIGNPDDPASEFANVCKPESGWNVIGISSYDIPTFTGEYVPDSVREKLTGPEWVEERKKDWGEGTPIYTSKVLGEFPEVSIDTLITPKMIKDAQDRELPGLGKGQFGVDVARYGTDESVIYRNRDGVVRLEWRDGKLSTMDTAGQVAKRLIDAGRTCPALIDTIGVGAGVYDRLGELSLPVSEFVAGAHPQEPNRFFNRRAEAYWHLRKMFEEGLIDLDPNDDKLAEELGAIKWKVDSTGTVIKVESKDDIRKRLGRSPDRADAVVMACYKTGLNFDLSTFIQESEGPSLMGEVMNQKW